VRLLPLLLLAAAARAQGPHDAEILAGRQAFEARKYEEAIACFRRAAAINPADWRGHAYESLALLQLAMVEPDRNEREALLREAERVAGELVKRNLLEFHDPLYRLVRGLSQYIQGDYARAHATLAEALRTPSQKFARYAEIDLHRSVQRAFSLAAMRIAQRLVAAGRFEEAEIELGNAAKGIPDDDPERPALERLLAAVAENLSKYDKAVAHLRKCIELRKDDAATVHELTGTIALIYLLREEYDKGRAVLDEAPKDSRQPDLVVARCTLIVKEALRDRSRLDAAIASLKATMRSHPPEYVYRLALLYRDLVFAKVGQQEVGTPEGRALLDEAMAIFKREIERRPECPQLYYALYRAYKLLGDAEQERRYQELHELKKKELDRLEKYDERGAPRCSG
jgi:tetratricopeptide (TPR) repeat protein